MNFQNGVEYLSRSKQTKQHILKAFNKICKRNHSWRYGNVMKKYKIVEDAWREKRLEMAFPMLPMLKIRTL
jgi:hypothetical protein